MSELIVAPSPPGVSAPPDWGVAVQGNAFDNNIERLGLWIGKNVYLSSPPDPSQYFENVKPQSLGQGDAPPVIYVVTHGWAPGLVNAVNNASGKILWWSQNARDCNGDLASSWAWEPVSATLDDNSEFYISQSGLFQQIYNYDNNAVILAYSWIDNSATDEIDYTDVDALSEVYQSEAYTHANGIRLADALVKAIDPSYWSNPKSSLRLIGHSHGSKVVTVAACELQQLQKPVAKLTILDSPESEATLAVNAANLLGFYLQRLTLAPPKKPNPKLPGVFVDNYPSCFGICYSFDNQLDNVVDVALAPTTIYDSWELGDLHTYAAAWYAGETQGAEDNNESIVGGLAWTTQPDDYSPVFNQEWSNSSWPDACSQWNLSSSATPIQNAFSYTDDESLEINQTCIIGSVIAGSSSLIFNTPLSSGGFSIFQGTYRNSWDGNRYGVVIDIAWTDPQPGDYLVIAMEKPLDPWPLETLFIMDGLSAPSGQTSVAISSFASSDISWDPLDIVIYFYASTVNSSSCVTLSNFKFIKVTSSDRLSLRNQRLQTMKKPVHTEK